MADLLNVMRVWHSRVDSQGNKTQKESKIYLLIGDMKMAELWKITAETDDEVRELMKAFQKAYDLGRENGG